MGNAKKNLSFFALMRKVHRHVTHLPGYKAFLGQWMCLEMICAMGKLALPLFFLCCHGLLSDLVDDIDMENPKMPGLSDIHPGLFIAGGLVALFQVGGAILSVIRNGLVDSLKEDFKTQQAVGVVQKVFRLPHDTHISTPTGEFPQLLGKVFQLDGIFTNLYTSVFPTIFEFGMAVSIFFIMFSGLIGDAGFTVAAVYIPLLLTLILCGYCKLQYIAAMRKSAQTKDAMKGLMAEWGNLMAVVQSYEQAHFFGNVDHEVGRAKASFERIVKDIKKFMKIDWESVALRIFGAILVFLVGAFTILHFSYGTEDLMRRGLEVIALVMYLFTFPAVLMMLGTAVAGLRTAASEYEVLHEFLDRASDTADVPEATPLRLEPNGEAPKIEFRNVTFAYPVASTSATPGVDNLILDDVSFIVEPGQTAGFVGASGCGKSTMLRLLMRFYAPQTGTILVNDQDIKFVTGESLRTAFSVVTQNAKLFNGTLRENVDYGKMGSSDADVIEACKRAELNLADLVEEEAVVAKPEAENHPLAENHDFPHPTAELRALDRKCGETGAKLSGGQQQRVALARALLKNGSVFLLDEPTAALDNKVSRELMKTMAEIQENKGSDAGRKTLLHITHRLEELMQADQIFYLNGGRIVERGTWAELASKESGKFAEQLKAKAALDDCV